LRHRGGTEWKLAISADSADKLPACLSIARAWKAVDRVRLEA
jgi:hypothetical protein